MGGEENGEETGPLASLVCVYEKSMQSRGVDQLNMQNVASIMDVYSVVLHMLCFVRDDLRAKPKSRSMAPLVHRQILKTHTFITRGLLSASFTTCVVSATNPTPTLSVAPLSNPL